MVQRKIPFSVNCYVGFSVFLFTQRSYFFWVKKKLNLDKEFDPVGL